MTHGMGWKPNTQDGSHGQASTLFAASPCLLAEPDMRRLARDRSRNGWHLSQGRAGSCWAFATARCIQLFHAVRTTDEDVSAGRVAPLASPRFLYWNGRNEEYASFPAVPDRRLSDLGTEPRLGLRALASLGFVPWEACPYSDDPATIAARPADSVYVQAYSQQGLVYGSVSYSGDLRAEECAYLLRQGCPPQFGMRVDEDFLNWQPAFGPISRVDRKRIVGGHMLAVVAVDTDARLVWFDNSWAGWGANGFGCMTFEVFGSDLVGDVAAVEFVPVVQR